MRIGTISGFELRVHWSTLVIFGLLTWTLAAAQLPDAAPDATTAAYVVAALAAGVAFYLALLAHEVSHAIVAEREGIRVNGLTLWMLGGVAELEGEPRTPGADLRIAGVGPAVSLAVGAVAAGAAVGLAAAGVDALVVATVGWLAGINFVLAVFNLVPAAPLDGGRILRAALWKWRGDRRWAAVSAARAGEAFGFGLIGLGLLSLFVPGVGGLWFLVLGWFLLNAARAERAHVELGELLAGVSVADVMSPDPVAAPAHATVDVVLEDFVMARRHSAFPIVDASGHLAGLITLDRLRDVPPRARAETSVRSVACPEGEVVTAQPGEQLADILPRLGGCTDGRVVVMEDDRIVGIVSSTDIARAVAAAGGERVAA